MTQISDYKGRKQPPRITYRKDNRIRFISKVNAQAHREFMGMLDYCNKDGYDNIIIDFSSVKNAYPNGMIPLISSSFADEFMGKLFLELGAMNFSARVKNSGMEKLIRDLLDRAIAQRLTQAADE